MVGRGAEMFMKAKSTSRRASDALWGPALGWPCAMLDSTADSLFWPKEAATMPTKPKLVPALSTATLCGSVRESE